MIPPRLRWLECHYNFTFDWIYDPDFGWLQCCWYPTDLSSAEVSWVSLGDGRPCRVVTPD